jgi:hypothetical protein
MTDTHYRSRLRDKRNSGTAGFSANPKLAAAAVLLSFCLASLHALCLLFTTALLNSSLRDGSVTGEALRTNPTAACASSAGLIRCVGFCAKNPVTVEAGNLYARFLGHYFQIFRGGDVPHHFTSDDDPVLKRLFGHTERHGSPCAREAAFDLRNPVDSAAVTASPMLDQRAVIKPSLNRFLYHEIPPLSSAPDGAYDPKPAVCFRCRPLCRLRLIGRPISTVQHHANNNHQPWMHGSFLVQAFDSLEVEEGQQARPEPIGRQTGPNPSAVNTLPVFASYASMRWERLVS